MNRELGQKLVEALRSGKYPKGKGKLCRINLNTGKAEYCCLGVLCEILEIPKVVYNRSSEPILTYGGSSDYLVGEVLMKSTLATQEGAFSGRTLTDEQIIYGKLRPAALTHINDISDTWEPVIEAIEKHMDTL